MTIKKTGALLVLILIAAFARSQPLILDEVIAVVGDKIILKSELDLEFDQLKKQDPEASEADRCELFNQLLLRKYLLNRAELDSIPVSDERVESELNKRVRYFVSLYGSEKVMEEQIGKTILQLKAENRQKIKDEILIDEEKTKILGGMKVSPNEVMTFFNKIPKDSLPNYDAELEVAQILRLPRITGAAKKNAYDKIADIRRQIINGSSFTTMALLYSEDEGSARQGGELGEFSRGDMVPEFETTAFKLKSDTVSPIIETKYGYHILQLIYRKGDRVNVRHVLIRPKGSAGDLIEQKNFLDSLRTKILQDSIKFEDAAKKFSDDENTSYNGGFFLDPNTGATKIAVKGLDTKVYFTIEKMKPGEVSKPEIISMEDGTKAYRILYLRSETKPHVANPKDDYQKIQAAALQDKQQKTIEKWLNTEKEKIYTRINPGYQVCIKN